MSNTPPYTPDEMAQALDNLGSLARNQVYAFLKSTVATGLIFHMPGHIKDAAGAAALLLTVSTAARSAEQ